jgi:hypothetical protein
MTIYLYKELPKDMKGESIDVEAAFPAEGT